MCKVNKKIYLSGDGGSKDCHILNAFIFMWRCTKDFLPAMPHFANLLQKKTEEVKKCDPLNHEFVIYIFRISVHV